jgi:HK97 family phage portal protein
VGLLSRLFERRAVTFENTVGILHDGRPVTSGVKVSEYTALNLAGWWAATRIVSEGIGSVPLLVYHLSSGGGRERARRHWLWHLLHDEPNPEMSSMVFRETLQAHCLTWGNGYAEIEHNGAGRARALWPIEPDRVSPTRDERRNLVYRVQNPDGPPSLLRPNQILHIPGLGFDGVTGYSVARLARESIGLGLATERYGSSWFGSGARPGGVLRHPGRLSDGAKKNLRESFRVIHGGLDRAHETAVLEEGTDWKPTGIPPEDSQFLQTREFQREEIALWFNLPPMKLWSSKTATYASSEQFAVDFITHTLRPWWVRWEQEYRRKLLLPSERDRFTIEHLADGLLRGDTESRTKALTMQFLNGALNLDEWRAAENRNPLPDGLGQIHFAPVNIQPVEKHTEEPKPAPPPPAGGAPSPSGNGNGTAPAVPPPPRRSRGRLRAAGREVWRDAVARVVHYQALATRKAAKRPGQFLAWLDGFAPRLEQWFCKAALPAARLRAALVGGDARQAVRKAAADHCARLRAELLEVAGASTPDQLEANVAACVGRWQQERPGEPAEELSGVSQGEVGRLPSRTE